MERIEAGGEGGVGIGGALPVGRRRRGIFLKNDVCIGSSLSEGMYRCCSCFVGGCFPGEIRRWNGKGMIEGIYMRMELSKVNSFWYGLEMEGKEDFNQSSNTCCWS